MRCPVCATENPAGMKFCGNCAAPLANRCAGCGFENPPHFKFCGECGAALHSSPSGSSQVTTAPAARTPEGRVASEKIRVAAEKPATEVADGERKTVTALFADIKGSMDLMEDLDPEDARALIDPALNIMINAVHRYDGYIVQSTGDGIFALFGAPVAHEDHAQRGLYAALKVQEEMRKYSAQLRQAGNPPVEVRIGLNTGEVVVRSIRTDDAHTEYTPIGHSTSLAARMQTLAPTGSIVITEHTEKLTAGYFELKALGPARIKGVTDPVKVFEVIGIGPLRTRLQMSASRGLSKFVGRQVEMEQLARAFMQARAGHGQIVAAMAEAGVGKSRLFHEFKLRSQSDALVLEAFSVSHGKASAYLPVVDLLKSYFRIADQDDERTRREKVTGKVLALDRALEETLPYLFALIGLSGAEESLAEVDSSIRRRRTREAVKSLVLRESLNQPLLLMFEDLHWIDEESEALLNLLADSIGTARILMLLNYRPEYHHQWGSKTYYTQLRLDPLGNENAVELLASLLGDAAGLAELQATIIQRTEGNPFFMEEMVQVLFDQGVLARNGVIKIARPLSSIQIPATVKGILAARIDKLSPVDKDTLQTLAVIGKEFPMALVRRVIAKPDDQLAATLSNLQLGEFIYEQPAFPESDYTFKHALTQEVAYDSMLNERRRQIHERTAAALEEMFAAKLDDHFAELAHHYNRSGNAPKAIQYLRLAGEQARTRSAYDDAVRYLREALATLATMPESHERDRTELSLQMALGPLVISLQGFSSPELVQILERAQELSRRGFEPRELIGVTFGLWNFHFANGNLRDALPLAEQLMTVSAEIGEEFAIAGANSAMGSSLSWIGEAVRAREYLEKAVKFYDRDLPRFLPMTQAAVIPSRCQLAWVLWLSGYPDQSRERINEAVSLAERLGHPFSLAFALTYSISHAHFVKEYATIRARAEALIELSTHYGFLHWQAAGKVCLGRVIAGQGELQAGLAMLKQGSDDLKAAGADLIHSYSLTLLAEVYLLMERRDEALETLNRALERVEQKNHRIDEVEILRLMGNASLLDRDGAPKAEQCFRRAIEIAQLRGSRSYGLRAATSLARLLAGDGRRDEARDLLGESYSQFTEGFATYDLAKAKSLLDSLSS
jgi:class 3 adenylate cyclase/tetratricopeptide (TPR) repeat protein